MRPLSGRWPSGCRFAYICDIGTMFICHDGSRCWIHARSSVSKVLLRTSRSAGDVPDAGFDFGGIRCGDFGGPVYGF